MKINQSALICLAIAGAIAIVFLSWGGRVLTQCLGNYCWVAFAIPRWF